jgi:hypothetical protein
MGSDSIANMVKREKNNYFIALLLAKSGTFGKKKLQHYANMKMNGDIFAHS